MAVFDIFCARIEDEATIHFGGDEERGNPEYRGFSCENEAACMANGVECQLFGLAGFRPFEVADAFEHFNS